MAIHPGSTPPPSVSSQSELLSQARRLAGAYRTCSIPAEDLVQESAAATLEAVLCYDPASGVRLEEHVSRAVRHHLRRLCRREHYRQLRCVPLPATLASDDLSPEAEASRRDFWHAARRALPPSRFHALHLCAMGHSDAEIAADWGCSRATVRSLRRRAIRQLQAFF